MDGLVTISSKNMKYNELISNNNMKIREKSFKTIVLGSTGVGKSTFLSRIKEKESPV